MPDYDDPQQQQTDPALDAPVPATPAGSSEATELAEPTEAKKPAPKSPLPPWNIPGSDWSGNPAPSLSTSDQHDNPQNRDRAGDKASDDPRGNGPMGPVPWWETKKPDLTPPNNPFTPQAQGEIKRKAAEEEAARRAKQKAAEDARKKLLETAKEMKGPDERGDYPMPPGDPRNA